MLLLCRPRCLQWASASVTQNYQTHHTCPVFGRHYSRWNCTGKPATLACHHGICRNDWSYELLEQSSQGSWPQRYDTLPARCAATAEPIKSSRMSKTSIAKKRWMRKNSPIAENGVHKNANKSGYGSSRAGAGTRTASMMGALTLSSSIRLPEKMAVCSVGLPRLPPVMGLGHLWLLRVWYQGWLSPLRLSPGPRLYVVSAPACYSVHVIPDDSWRLI
jgi:hypothetical protein